MERHLAAILSYDVAGYSLLMGRDEAGTLAALKAFRSDVIEPAAERCGGKTFKLMGDGALMEFASAVDATRFAVEVQCAMRERNAEVEEGERIALRIGINVGDVIAEGDDIFGDGVNVAARLEGMANPGGICIRRNVRNQVRDKLALDFEDLGEVEVKNIERPIRAFHVVLNDKAEALAATPIEAPAEPQQRWPSRMVQGAVGIALSLVLIAGLAWWRPWAPDLAPARAERMAFPLPDRPSIAILPFDNLSEEPDTDFLSDGLTEDIIANVSRIPDLFVVSHDAIARYRKLQLEPRQVAEELGVRYILTGSFRAQRERVRVSAQLADTTVGKYVWAESFDRDLSDVLSLQGEIALEVSHALFDKVTGLRGVDARTSRLLTNSLEAWELEVRAIAIYRQLTRENLAHARELWKRALGIDPGFAQAWARLAVSYMVENRLGWSEDPKLAASRAREYAEKAIALDPENMTAHNVLAFLTLYARKHDEALDLARRSRAIDPNNTFALYTLAEVLRYSGEFDEAVEVIREAMRRNPDYPDWYLYALAVSLRKAARYDESIEAYTQLLGRNPDYNFAHSGLALIYYALGRMEEARREAKLEIKVNPDISLNWMRRVVPYRDRESLERSIKELAELGIPD